MKGICLICADKRFARMIELELKEAGLAIRTVTEKLNPPALQLVTEGSELVIFDTDYYENDLSFVKKNEIPFVVFGKNKTNNLPENVTCYFERPFSVMEFTEHITSRVNFTPNTNMTYTPPKGVGNMELDPYSKQVTIGEKIIKFSPREFALLSLLYKNKGRIVSRKEVLDTVWGKDYNSKNNADNVYINYLRKKLDEPLGVKIIHTVRSKGYMMK